MNTAHLNPASAGSFPEQFSPRRRAKGAPPGHPKARARGSTAVNETHSGPRHVVGSALRAIRIFADTAFRVTVMGADSVKL